jgi:putative NADPH-quinone reductase
MGAIATSDSGKNILVINGHPDPAKGHLGDALVFSYMAGAQRAGHRVEVLDVAALQFPLVRGKHEWETQAPCADILAAQQSIERAQHILLIYPLWLGDMPALLKGFLEQVLRPGFAFAAVDGGKMPEKKLLGKSARIVVTMGMPAFVYRWFYGAHSLKSLKRNILAFCGIKPIRSTLIGMVESANPDARLAAMRELERLGSKAQ